MPNGKKKLTAFADDLTALMNDSKEIAEFKKVLNSFQKCSGMKINEGKSEYLMIGKNYGKPEEEMGNIRKVQHIKITGIFLGQKRMRKQPAS